MTEIVPASIYLTHSELVQGANPVGRIQDTRYNKFEIAPELEGYGFNVKTVASPLNDPAISHANLISQYGGSNTVFSEQVTSLYDKQNNYFEFMTGSKINVSG